MKSNIGAIILAAGNSRRMGQCKFLLPMSNGLTFFENIIQTFSDYGIKNIVVVTQFKYLYALKDLCSKMETKPKFVVNNSPEHERFYSLQLGIQSLEAAEYCFIHNADNPFVDFATLEKLDVNKNNADYICPVFNNKGGHPVLVNAIILKHLLNCPANAILKEELKTKRRLDVPVENELITVDIDTPEDYIKYFV